MQHLHLHAICAGWEDTGEQCHCFLNAELECGALRASNGMRRVLVPVLADVWDLGHEEDRAPAGGPAEERRQRLRFCQHGAWQESGEGRLTRCGRARQKGRMDTIFESEISHMCTLGL